MRRGWYHCIELKDGSVTPGFRFRNVAATRKVFAAVDPAGKSVLEVGCADGLMSLLAFRRGADWVMAWDRAERWTIQRLAHEFDAHALRHASDNDLRRLADLPMVDVVICSGLLYHTFDPLAVLLRCRSRLGNGGAFVLETAAYGSPKQFLQWNGGRYYPDPGQANFWFPSLGLLDQWLILARLQPLGASWINDGKIIRLAVVCRAVERVETDSAWQAAFQQPRPDTEPGVCFAEFIDWQACEQYEASVPIASDGPIPSLWQWCQTHRALTVDEIERGITLRLGDME